MKKARIITMILCIAAALVFSGYFNILGGIALSFVVESEKQDYFNFGMCLLVSSAFLMSGTVIACFKKVWLPVIFNVIGTLFYIYTVSGIYAIPNELVPKQQTEPLAERHLFTVIVTVLLFAFAVFNFFDAENVCKRDRKRRLKEETENRELSDSEKLV